jgi:hypothetical protein
MARKLQILRRAALSGFLLLGTATDSHADILDAKLGRMAYAALQADEELADLNLGVKALEGGTIVLWGPSPSMTLTKKAEAILKKLPGVVSVKIECDRDAVIDPLVRKVEADLKGSTPPTEVKTPLPVPPTPPATPVTIVRQVTTVEKPRTDAPLKPPATTLLEPTTVIESNTTTIERIRKGEARFAKLRVEERDGRIVISGPTADPADAWALAKKIGPYVGDKNIVVSRSR